jgi:hypothetical protein
MLLQQRRRTRRKREEKIGGKKSCFNLVSICKMSPLTKYFFARTLSLCNCEMKDFVHKLPTSA